MNKRNIVIAVVVVVLIILGIIINNSNSTEEVLQENDKSIIEANFQILVDVKGEVKVPGLYCLSSNSRVVDAINIAGGLTPNANTDIINLATKLEDGMVVNIFKKEIIIEEKISINKATIEELIKLPGIGEAKAKNIIQHRNLYGYFMSLEDILKVEGINENLYKQIKEFICL